MVQKFSQLIPSEALAAPESVHVNVVCDGCGAQPLTGPRFRCQVCPDYDLCGSCYMRKDEIHPGHSFDCMPKVRAKVGASSARVPVGANAVTRDGAKDGAKAG